jgi:molybdopterin-synthase adenylyltransferase
LKPYTEKIRIAVILSKCNRVEVHIRAEDIDFEFAEQKIDGRKRDNDKAVRGDKVCRGHHRRYSRSAGGGKMNFTEEQRARYSRHIMLKDIGVEGQSKIIEGKVLIIGVGGLGSPAALYLAAAGVGTIGIADGDKVELSNLQRQVIHFTPDIGRFKAESAKDKMEAINPDIKVNVHKGRVTAGNAADIIKDYDFIIDCTDNFPAKFLINDACVMLKKSFSHGGVLRFDGQAMTHVPGKACYRCIFRSMPPKDAVSKCSQDGILGAVAGMLGTIQAVEAIKFIMGKKELLMNKLLVFNALDMSFRIIDVRKDSHCPVCGENPSIKELVEEEQSASLAAPRPGPPKKSPGR